MIQAEGILDYPLGAEGFGRRLPDAFQVRWIVPQVREHGTAPEEEIPVAEVGAWCFPAGIYHLSIIPEGAPADERRVLLGDRRRRHREVDKDSLAFEDRGSGERRVELTPYWWR